MVVAAVPDRGDIVWISLGSQVGHGQSGRRPAVVLSPGAYNGKVGLALLCPITGQIKGYPLEVVIRGGLPTQDAVLSDQINSLDWRERHAEIVCSLPEPTLDVVLRKLRTLLD